MRELFSIPFEDFGEWIFIAAAEEPERVFKSLKDAMAELVKDGWEIVEGPGVVGWILDALNRNDSYGFKLRRGTQ